jgi:hypothetical protein
MIQDLISSPELGGALILFLGLMVFVVILVLGDNHIAQMIESKLTKNYREAKAQLPKEEE